MATRQWNEADGSGPARRTSFSSLYREEDWWAIWLGLGIVLLAVGLFSGGNPVLKYLAVNPGGIKWNSLDDIAKHFGANYHLYL